MADRVDKRWQEQGLSKYSNEAIFATLAHYGASVSEADFKQLAEQKYPLAIASEWLPTWKGTGQFGRFPYPAAAELWSRFAPGKLSPGTVAEALVGLLAALNAMLADAAGAPVGKRFAKLKELKPQIPLEKGAIHEDFAEEIFAHLPEPMLELFDEIAEKLATAGHPEDADEFVEWEEFLIPIRRGTAKAMLRAAKGEKEPAIAELVAIASDGARGDEDRLLAVDALIHLQANEQARAPAEALLEQGEKAEDHHLALSAGGRLAHLLEVLSDRAGLAKLEPRMEKIAAEHERVHPHHHH